MKKVLLALALLSIPYVTIATPTNILCAKQNVIKYYESGEFDKEVDKVTQQAEKYLTQRVSQNKNSSTPHKLAIVFDIDDTALSNFKGFKTRDFSNLPDQVDAGYLDTNAPAIKGVLNLYNRARENGVSVFFISFRPVAVQAYTMQNLQKMGFSNWEGLYLPNVIEKKSSPVIFKSKIRQALTENGYDIILNVGDQESDFEGGFADQTAKIPNPLYVYPTICAAKHCA